MSTPNGTDDESIGRPSEWREGRYEQAGKPVPPDPAKPVTDAPPDEVSTPVTRRDYTDDT